jgi:hypothetical protein
LGKRGNMATKNKPDFQRFLAIFSSFSKEKKSLLAKIP